MHSVDTTTPYRRKPCTLNVKQEEGGEMQARINNPDMDITVFTSTLQLHSLSPISHTVCNTSKYILMDIV